MDATPFPSGAAGPDDLVVYYKPGCPFAIRLRVALTFHGVPLARGEGVQGVERELVGRDVVAASGRPSLRSRGRKARVAGA
jgi:hypothetical protein